MGLVKVRTFIENGRLFDFLAKERQYLHKHLGLTEYSVMGVARRMGMGDKVLRERELGRVKSHPTQIVSALAKALGVKAELIIDPDFLWEYNAPNARLAYAELNEIRKLWVRNGDRQLTLPEVAKMFKVSTSHLSQIQARKRDISLDFLVDYAEVVDRRVYVRLTHDFRHVT